MTVIGVVPTPTTNEQQAPVNVVSLYGPDGSLLAQISITAVGSQMAAFLTLYGQQNSHLTQLKSSGVDAGYIQLYTVRP